MFRIGEFSRIAQVSVRMLRHYDELGLLRPAQVDRFTDYRSYSAAQLPRLHRIRALSDLGLPLKDLAGLIDRPDADAALASALAERRAQIAREASAAAERLARLDTRLALLAQAEQPPLLDVVLKSAPAQTLACVSARVATLDGMGPMRGAACELLYKEIARRRLAAAGAELALYDVDEYRETDIGVRIAVPVDAAVGRLPSADEEIADTGFELRRLPAAERLACVAWTGLLPQVTVPIAGLFRWVAAQGWQPTGALREVHLFGRETDRVLVEPVTIELQLPAAPAAPGKRPQRAA
ncbi:MAG: MerR family transcriptional regulator [Betaproteobacteria bacterium]